MGSRRQVISRRFFLGLGSGFGLLLLLGGAPSAESLVTSFSGQGEAVTERFKTETGWRVEWQVDSGLTEIFLEDTGSGIRSLVANPVNPDEGAIFYAQGGEFYFRIRGKGGWSLQVYEIP